MTTLTESSRISNKSARSVAVRLHLCLLVKQDITYSKVIFDHTHFVLYKLWIYFTSIFLVRRQKATLLLTTLTPNYRQGHIKV